MLNRIFAEKKEVLLQAAKAVCRDPMFVYDTIYLAVIKTKQKYKKLANKERAVEVCISLMKQPKNHVKQSFESVEDCIEKALAAKIVPWKPILSAVAVVLATAIILPFCLPKKPTYIDPKGFVMEGAQSFASLNDNNSVVLQNYHAISALGAHDIRELSGVEMNNLHFVEGKACYNSITTTQGKTLLIQSYVNGKKKTAEFILYEATSTGWVEVGRDAIRYTVLTHASGTDYNLDRIYMVDDMAGNVYIFSVYNEGLQVHVYTAEGSFRPIEKTKLMEHRQVADPYGISVYTMPVTYFARYNSTKQAVDILFRTETEYMVNDTRVLSFEFSKEAFSDSVPLEKLNNIFIIYDICLDDKGGLYLASQEYGYGKNNIPIRSDYCIYYIDANKNVSQVALYHTLTHSANSGTTHPYALEWINGALHLVHRSGNSTVYAIYCDGIEVSKTTLKGFSTDSYYYMGFFFLEDVLHFAILTNHRYINVARIEDGAVQIIAEFALPLAYSCNAYTSNHGFQVNVTSATFNYILGELENTDDLTNTVSSCFFQIVFIK